MLNVKEILKAAKQVADEKGLSQQQVVDAIEASLAAAYKREYGKRGEVVKSKMDEKTGDLKLWKLKTVVDESTVRIVEEEPTEEMPEGVSRREEPVMAPGTID